MLILFSPFQKACSERQVSLQSVTALHDLRPGQHLKSPLLGANFQISVRNGKDCMMVWFLKRNVKIQG